MQEQADITLKEESQKMQDRFKSTAWNINGGNEAALRGNTDQHRHDNRSTAVKSLEKEWDRSDRDADRSDRIDKDSSDRDQNQNKHSYTDCRYKDNVLKKTEIGVTDRRDRNRDRSDNDWIGAKTKVREQEKLTPAQCSAGGRMLEIPSTRTAMTYNPTQQKR